MNAELPIIQKAYDLIKWYVPILNRLPRSHKFQLGDRMVSGQFFANLYLSPFDHFVKRQLKLSQYLRYVDDFAAFSNDRSVLAEARIAMEEKLAELRLKMHPVKSQLFETHFGANFFGFRILPDRIRVRNDNLRRSRRRMKALQRQYEAGTAVAELGGTSAAWRYAPAAAKAI